VGESFHFSPADIHRVRHAGSGPAVTLHVYSPPLLRMGAYEVGDDGVLARHTMSYEQELRPSHSDPPA
jgi:predicted metal-dependent enzyme (double-stranded beta helix superfamily)